MAKFQVSVSYEGCIDIIVDADDAISAEIKALSAFEDIPATEIEANICGVAASADETDEEDE